MNVVQNALPARGTNPYARGGSARTAAQHLVQGPAPASRALEVGTGDHRHPKTSLVTIVGVGRLLLFVVLAAIVAVPGIATAQQPAVATVAIFGARTDSSELSVSVSALDAGGNPISGLGVSQFQATIDGTPASILGADTGLNRSLPLALVVVVDTSGSMAGEPIAAAKAAIRPIIQSLQPGDRAAIVSFANAVKTVVPFTGDATALGSGLDSLAATGNTALYAAVGAAVSLAQEAPEPRKAVILLSDGEDFGNVSGVTRDQALAAAGASRLPFFAVGLGAEVDSQFLQGLNSTGAGQVFVAATPAQLGQLYDRISERLRLQYTLRVALPASLAGGEHRLRVTAGPASAESTFTVAKAPASGPKLSGIDGEIRAPATVTLEYAAGASNVAFALDGAPIAAQPDGRSVQLDPYDLAPGADHTLAASFDLGGGRSTTEIHFTVAALAPQIVAPAELPGLAAGDLVRLTIVAQGGVASARFLLDNKERGRVDSAPYEFTVPTDLAGGDHTLKVVVEGPGGSVEREFSFAAAGSGSNMGAYLIVALAAAAALAAAGYGGRLAYVRWQDRERPQDLSGVSDALAAWAAERRAPNSATPGPAQPTVATPSAPGAWGVLVVVSGKDRGKRFDLKDDVELIGRGKACSVRLRDKGIEPAHFLLSREGSFQASTPSCRVVVGGAESRGGQLADGEEVRIGTTTLRFDAVKAADNASPSQV